MPIYEYRRDDGTTFEVLQKFSDPPITEDPETGRPVTRVYSPVAVHFKGSGFYNTDYGTAKRKRETDASAKSGADAHDAKGADKKGSDSGSSSSDSSSSPSSDGKSASSSSATPASSPSSSSKD
jgi:putative FmdB family regulatory protein